MCGNGWSKDLNISENKAILSAKLKIADITQHSIVSNEVITHKETNKGIDLLRLDVINRVDRYIKYILSEFEDYEKELKRNSNYRG